ncbi:MAG: glycine zipper 2TM domain-containing protein [Nitrospirae bacterium]|nr:glycine zipper 2TM domain-containing protein [Nitrospirota bacterium]
MKKFVSFIVLAAFFALAAGCTQYHTQGAAVGGAAGGLAGALLDHKNPWKGGVIGAALGAILGATITDISMRASQEAASTGKTVQYKTEDGRGVYRAEPVDFNAQTNCHKVHETVWEDGKMVKDQIKEICEGTKTEPKY